MSNTQYTFPGAPGDTLSPTITVPIAGTVGVSVEGGFIVSYAPDGTPTNVAGVPGDGNGVHLTIPTPFGKVTVATATNYGISFANGVYTVTATTLDGLGVATFTYTGQNPTSVNVAVSGQIAGFTVPLLSNPAATVTVTQNVIPCFAAGTLIRTSRGEVAVEDLRVGDRVETTSGMSRPIVWLGNSDVDLKMMAHPIAYKPIRIAADAFGPSLPYADLTVSPGHGLCVKILDEVIVPPVVLVNGSTITQLDVDHVSYWHVELDAHDIMYANGLPAESYINVGNRGFFGAGVDPADSVRTLADYCRPYVAEGALVTAMREQLQRRAENLGWRCETSPFVGLHIDVDGARIEPTIGGMNARFTLPANASEVWLVSAASVPAQVMDSHDTRRLGVLLQGLRIGGREVALGDALLDVGFHAVEDGARGPQRWTADRARLPASLWQGAQGDLAVEIELAAPPLPKWVAPERPPRAQGGRRLSLVVAA